MAGVAGPPRDDHHGAGVGGAVRPLPGWTLLGRRGAFVLAPGVGRSDATARHSDPGGSRLWLAAGPLPLVVRFWVCPGGAGCPGAPPADRAAVRRQGAVSLQPGRFRAIRAAAWPDIR